MAKMHRGCRDIELCGSFADNELMGRRKNFSREEVLEKAMPVFWKHGFADTSLLELERATGVNKSGLYTEFQDKEDLFVARLRHYLELVFPHVVNPRQATPSEGHDCASNPGFPVSSAQRREAEVASKEPL
jgi:AcrR family transcriptional regulator